MTERTLPGRPVAGGWDDAMSARLVSGDAAALTVVYDQLAGYVFGLAKRVLRDHHRAEEVTQEVFSQLWEHPDRFDPARASMRSYLGMLAHRRAVDQVRRSEAASLRDTRFGIDGGVPPDITEAILASLDAQHVREAVRELPDEQRTPVMLAYFGGRTFREVAEMLNIPEGTAKSRIRAALERLARTLERKVVPT